MATPATTNAAVLPGNLVFSAGGMSVGFLIGAFVKSVVYSDTTGNYTITYQNASGVEQNDVLIHRSDRGAWNTAYTYHRGDAVQHDTSSWISIGGNNQGNEPVDDSTDWMKMFEGAATSGTADALPSITFPTPDATNVYDVVNHFGFLYRNIPVQISQIITYSSFGDGEDVSDLWGETTGTYRFRGITYTSGVDTPLDGDVVLLPEGGFRHRSSGNWRRHLRSPDGWVGGPYADEAEANNHPTSLNAVTAFDNALQLVTAYTAGTIEYLWVTGEEVSYLISQILGAPTAERVYQIQNFLGKEYRVEPRPTGHSVTWTDYDLLDDVSALWSESAGTYRWRGETYPSGVITPAPATGDVIKEPAGHFRHRNSSNAWVHLADPDNFIGDYNNEDAADNHVTEVGQTSLYSHNLHEVATYIVGITSYVWAKGVDAREVSLDFSTHTGHLDGVDNVQWMADILDGLVTHEVAYALLPEQHWDTSYDAGLPNIHSSDRQWYGQAVRIKGHGVLLTDARIKYGENGGGEDNRWEVWGLTRVADNHLNYEELLYTSDDWATVANVLHTQHLNLQSDPLQILTSDYEYIAVVVDGFEQGRAPGFARRAYDVDDDPLNENDEGAIDIIDYVAVVGHGSNLIPANNNRPAVGSNVYRIHDHSIAMRLDFIPLLDVIGATVDEEPTVVELTEGQVTDETSDVFGTVSGELLAAAVAEFESAAGGGGSGGGYGDWTVIGSLTGAISGNPVTVALNTNETIDDYEELYIHIEANNANDQRVVSPRFRVLDIPTTTLAGGGLGIPFAGNATDEGAILVRRNAAGDSLVLDAFGSVINFPATAVTSIYARELTAAGGTGGTDRH